MNPYNGRTEGERPKTTPMSSSSQLNASTSRTDVFKSSKRVASLIQQEPSSNYFLKRDDCNNTYNPKQHMHQHRIDSSRAFSASNSRPSTGRSEEWILPSDRQDYIRNHDATKLARLHAQKDENIPPTWTKVTKTPWTDKAKLCTGYGVAMERTKISSDAPNYFLDPHFDYGIKHPHSDHHPRFARLAFTGTFTKAGRNNEPNESAHVLPGGQSILNATLNSKENLPKSNYRKFFHDKQTHLDHIVPPRTAPPPPIQWNY